MRRVRTGFSIFFFKNKYLDDVQGLVNGGLGVKGEASIDLGGDLSGNDLKNLLAELDEKTVESGIDLFVNGATL